MAMNKGHLDQTRSNQRSTKSTTPASPTASSLVHLNTITPKDTDTPADHDHTIRSHHIFASCEPITGKVASDPTGRFILPSSSGNTYLLIVYDYDSNMIFAEPMKSRSGPDHLAAYKRIHELLTSRGLRPQLQRLDNEASTQLKQFLSDHQVDFQLVPPHAHRRNSAERAIRVFKNHFIAGLCSTDPSFPLHLWDKLLPQALLTLNLLRSSHINPKLSAQALIHGPFDFNRTPLAPPGTKVLIHIKPNMRETWAPHGTEGWYIGPALNHYRCYRVYANETRSERIADTLAWFPTEVKMPTASSTDAAITAANDLVTALQNPHPASALSPLADNEHAALQQLAEIFRNRTDPSTVPVPPGFEPLPPINTTPSDTTLEPRVVPPINTTSSDTTLEPRVVPPNIPTDTTYIHRTINPAKRRRMQRIKQKAKQGTAAPSTGTPEPTQPATIPPPTGTLQPIIPFPSSPIPTPPQLSTIPRHNHNTRYRALSIAANHLLAQSLFPHCTTDQHQIKHHANAVTDPLTGATLEYRDLIKGPDRALWEKGWCNEFRRLGPSGTKTIKAIAFHHIPKGRAIGNLRIVAALKPLKTEMHRIRFTIAHHHHDFDGATSTPTVDMPTVKCHINSTISTPNAKYATMDISDFYLNTIMARPEYMRIPLKIIPQQIIDEYDLTALAHNGYIYYQVDKGLYGLVQAGKLAYDQLLERLLKANFYPAPHAPGLFLHKTRSISFTLCVDDFGIKYTQKDDIDFLINTIQQHYKVTIDWTGSNYLGLTLDWDYTNRTVDLSMPGYIESALHRFQHPMPTKPQHSPHAWTAPTYGAATQWAIDADDSPPPSLHRP